SARHPRPCLTATSRSRRLVEGDCLAEPEESYLSWPARLRQGAVSRSRKEARQTSPPGERARGGERRGTRYRACYTLAGRPGKTRQPPLRHWPPLASTLPPLCAHRVRSLRETLPGTAAVARTHRCL